MYVDLLHLSLLSAVGFVFFRLKGEDQQLMDYRKKLDEFSCWMENVENSLEMRPTFNPEENLRELKARSIKMCMSACVSFINSESAMVLMWDKYPK